MCRPERGRRGRRALARGAGLALLALAAAACQQQMADQPRYEPLRRSTFFGDERSARPLPEGTVPHGDPERDAPLDTGGALAEAGTLPVPLTRAVLARGRERFDIFCSPCHDRTGSGNGMVAQRGYRHPPSYHTDRLRQARLGHFVDVMTRGFGAMPDYADQVPLRDRWAIAAYIRALQWSQHATLADVPPGERRRLGGEPR